MSKKFVIKESTRKRCNIISLTAETRNQFRAISLDHFSYLWEIKQIDFSLFIQIGEEMIEYMRAAEFSTELLEHIWQASLKDGSTTNVFVLKKEYTRFAQALGQVRKKKINQLIEKQPFLDRRTLETFANLSEASQMILRGGITQSVATEVKASAAYMVQQLMDNVLAMSTLTRMITIDPTLYDHSASVAMFATILAKQYLNPRLPLRDAEVIAQCGLYHDAGKSCVPHAVLNKPGVFTPEEYEIMKTHADHGYQELMTAIAAGAPIDKLVALVALEHHERFDGCGYPRGKKGRQEEDAKNGIHPFARIVSIADAYSALLMKRVYKPALPAEEALQLMHKSAAKDFDMHIFEPFLKGVEGSLSKLEERRKELEKSHIYYKDSDLTILEQVRAQRTEAGGPLATRPKVS